MNVVTVRLADVEVEAVLRALDGERFAIVSQLRMLPEIDEPRASCPCNPCRQTIDGRERQRASLGSSLRAVDGAVQALEGAQS